VISIQAQNTDEAIEQLVDLLVETGKISDKSMVLDAALEREAKGSTGIGGRVAVPHAKCEAVVELSVSLAIARPAIEWQAIDSEPCEVLFFMAAPAGASGPHIRSLALLARLLKFTDLRERLLGAKTADEAHLAILEEEAALLLESSE